MDHDSPEGENMSGARSAITAVVAALLAIAAWNFSRAPVASAVSGRLLIPAGLLDAELVDEVRLDRDGMRFRFERRGESWWQTEPVVHAVDGWAVRQFVSRLAKTESVRMVHAADATHAEGPSLADAGFAPALGRIEIHQTAADGRVAHSVVVELGKRSLAGRAYARVTEPAATTDSFEVVDSALHAYALERDPKDFRRREVFIDLSSIDRVTLSTDASLKGREFTLAREGRDFRIVSPIRGRADRVASEELLEALKRARSTGFIVDKPAELAVYGLAPAVATLTVESGGTSSSLLIGSEVSIGAQDRFGIVDGTQTVIRLPALELASIIPRIEQLLDAVATSVRPRDVGAIELVSSDGRLLLRRGTNAWSATVTSAAEIGGPPRSGTVDAAAVDRLLAALTSHRARSVKVAAYPADAEQARVTLLGFADEPLDTVRIARGTADEGIVFENGDGVLRIHGNIEVPLNATALGFAEVAGSKESR